MPANQSEIWCADRPDSSCASESQRVEILMLSNDDEPKEDDEASTVDGPVHSAPLPDPAVVGLLRRLKADLKSIGTYYRIIIEQIRRADMTSLPSETGLPLRQALQEATASLRLADEFLPLLSEDAGLLDIRAVRGVQFHFVQRLFGLLSVEFLSAGRKQDSFLCSFRPFVCLFLHSCTHLFPGCYPLRLLLFTTAVPRPPRFFVSFPSGLQV